MISKEEMAQKSEHPGGMGQGLQCVRGVWDGSAVERLGIKGLEGFTDV